VNFSSSEFNWVKVKILEYALWSAIQMEIEQVVLYLC